MITLPPYARLLGLYLEESDAAPVLVMPFAQKLVGRPGFVHGGALGGVLEMAAITALRHALASEPARIKPINITVDFMRGGRERDTRAQGNVTRLGKRIANVEAKAWQDDPDRPIATARLNFLIQRQDAAESDGDLKDPSADSAV